MSWHDGHTWHVPGCWDCEDEFVMTTPTTTAHKPAEIEES